MSLGKLASPTNPHFTCCFHRQKTTGEAGAVSPVSETVRFRLGTPAPLGQRVGGHTHTATHFPYVPSPSAKDPSCQDLHPHMRKARLEERAALMENYSHTPKILPFRAKCSSSLLLTLNGWLFLLNLFFFLSMVRSKEILLEGLALAFQVGVLSE